RRAGAGSLLRCRLGPRNTNRREGRATCRAAGVADTQVLPLRGGQGLDRDGAPSPSLVPSRSPRMPAQITPGFRALVDAAEREIETLPVAEAIKLHGRDDVVFVDLRDPRELEREGRMPGAFHCTRGMLEFWIDPESPYHKPQFAQDKRYVF